ncbi:hypothetical protein HYC85_012213 [Camellia sinensis]|uniref:Aconitase/3-isopropylmalate dehydratase large subunit alpha/beta/alpha domain-containing protein n=1 Tax=Camellia sinensis TaxID=4442 RepID=A0A7J7HBB2_CAMSI|nr:hypothetical protein HYC85_012213 [Camellia sinensis]
MPRDPYLEAFECVIIVIISSAFHSIPQWSDGVDWKSPASLISSEGSPPWVPVDLVIDHSVQVDVARSENAVQANMGLEFQRNKERFAFLKWGSNAFQTCLLFLQVLVLCTKYGSLTEQLHL